MQDGIYPYRLSNLFVFGVDFFSCVASAAQLNKYCCPSLRPSVGVSEGVSVRRNAEVKTLMTH